jgi:hypothetical protein
VADVSVGEVPAHPAASLDALRYLPPQSDAVFGLDAAGLNSKLVLGFLAARIAGLGDETPLDPLRRATGQGLKDIDHVVVAGRIDPTRDAWQAGKPFPVDVTTYVVQTRVPFDRAQLLHAIKAGPPHQIDGKEFYVIPTPAKAKPVHLILPSDRVMVVSLLPEAQLGSVLKRDASAPGLAPEMLAALRALDRAHAWMVMPADRLRSSLPAGTPPTLLPHLLDLAGRARAVGLGVRFQGEQAHLTLALTGPDAATGQAISDLLKDYWLKQARAALDSGAGAPSGAQPALKELAQGLRIQLRGESATAEAAVSFKALDGVLKVLE